MKANYPVRFPKGRNSAELRISNPIIVEDIRHFGISRKKSAIFPDVPPRFLNHFIRGYLDGDGWIVVSHKRREISVGFASGNRGFLEKLIEKFNEHVVLTNSHLRAGAKKTKRGKVSSWYSVEWYGENAYHILDFLYSGLEEDDLFLRKKYNQWLKARDLYSEIRKGRKWRWVEYKFNKPMKELLSEMLANGLNGVQISRVLGVSKAVVYRWLERTGIRKPSKKIHRKVLEFKCFSCGRVFKTSNPLAKYCSLSCVARSPLKKTGKVVKCATCNNEIYRPQWWFGRNSVPFCSRKCVGKWHKMRLRFGLLRRNRKNGRFLPSTSFREVLLYVR